MKNFNEYTEVLFECKCWESESRSIYIQKKDSTVQKHINVWQSCKENQHLFDNFSICKICNTQYSTKI